ncbi:MAG: class I SAM-dependent methyltransferase [Planctomycetes bacterium]|nr:class I SAM-dependent methyltransferase [Planctomycetota bacterium]
MPQCLICQTDYEPFISFGKMPIANGFLTEKEFEKEYFFELKTGFCPKCKMVQLVEQPDREMMFHENYAFFSSTSARQVIHFKEFADLIAENYLNSDDPFVVELGSNDGIMLQHFKGAGLRHLGVEPSANVAAVAIEKGIATISEFFDEELAKKIIAEHGQADAVLAANVMCHIPYLHSVAAGIKLLLKPDGVLMFEDPYLGDIVEKTSYDQIYDEHAFYFSVASVSYLFEEHGLEVVDVMPQNVHGGSMRYVIAHKGAKDISAAAIAQRKKEEELGLHLPETFERLRRNIETSRDKLVEILAGLKKEGKRVVGYAATSKSTTVTNYCGIGPELVEFISDTTPIKQGKYSPGAHIPVKVYEEFCGNYPEYALLFGWNHAAEIMAKEQKFMESGGKWIIYVPEVKIC